MAIPFIEGWTVNDTGGSTAYNITLTKPSGVQTGDLLLLIVGSDQGNTADWNEVSGWTQFVNANGSVADANLACYWRIADGSEAGTVLVTAVSADERYGWYIRISGVDQSTPIHVIGTPQSTGASTNHVINSINTTVDDCLAIYALAFDGGDGTPFGCSDTGWAEVDEHNSGTSWGDACGCWGSKDMASFGATGNVTISSSASDGSTRVQFAIAPGGPPPPPKVTQYLAGNDLPEYPYPGDLQADKIPCPPPY